MGGMAPSQISMTFFVILIAIIITILGIYYGCIKAENQEYGVEDTVDTEEATQKIIMDKNKDKEVESIFKGIVEKNNQKPNISNGILPDMLSQKMQKTN